jgi:hypothetical protein
LNGHLSAFLGAGLAGAALVYGANAATPAPAPAPAPASTAALVPPANPAAPAVKPVVPPVPEDYFQRYGKILTPGTEPSHPLKLAMPFPDVGQIKIPSAEELAMRDKIERLTTMSDADIRKDLDAWPAFDEMTLGDEGAMLVRIQMFKDRRDKIAQDRAHALGLLTLKPDQMQKFETEYWNKRMQMDAQLSRQFGAVYKTSQDKLDEELFREFSTPGTPVPPPKPPAPALAAQNKPAPALAAAPKPAVPPAPPH